MKKALTLFLVFFKINWMQETEYRVNYIISSLMSVGWAFSFLLMARVVFGNVRTIGGWSENEVVLLIITQTLAWGIMTLFLWPGLEEITGRIKYGLLDQLLTKPVSSRLLLAVTNQNMDGLLRIPVLTVIAYLLSSSPHPGLFTVYLLLILLGVFTLYNVFFIIHATAVWLVDLSNIGHLNNAIADAAQFPPSAFNKWTRAVLFYAIPTVFIAAVPVRALLGDPALPLLAGSVTAAAVTFYLSQAFWRFALRHYSSASS